MAQVSLVLEQLARDVRHTLRSLLRARGFSLTVIATLGLGIGANTVMFHTVDSLMFRPLAYLAHPETVHRLYWQWQERSETRTTTSAPYTRYLDLQRDTASFAQFAGFHEQALAVGEGESARELPVAAVSASFFDFFTAQPALGRFFGAAEDVTPRGAAVAVLSHAFWRSEYAARDVRGDTLQVGNVRATIIGVAPEGFNGVNDATPPALYIPITTYAASYSTNESERYFTRYSWGWMNILVRRRTDVSIAQAEADATQAFTQSWTAALADWKERGPAETAKPRAVVSSVRLGGGPDPSLEARMALWLGAVSMIVLIIAIANVANLSLARAMRRRREVSVRLALGISRGRLMAQSLIEALVLSCLGAAAALVVAQAAATAIRQLLIGASASQQFLLADWRTLGVTFGLTIATGILVGLVPALVAGRGDLVQTLRSGGGRGSTAEGTRVRALLLLAQAALSVVLLVGAVLFVRSLDSVREMRIGYEPERVLHVSRVVRGATFDDAMHRRVREELLAAARSLATVESAAWISSAPFISTSSNTLFVPGIGSTDSVGRFSYQATTPDYFKTMGTRILRGRGLTAEDRSGTPDVAIVSDSMARTLWPHEEAIGKCFRMRTETAPCITIVGVAEDIVQRSFTDAGRGHYYLSIDQFTRTSGNGMVVKVRGNPAAEVESVRRALQRAMPGSSYVVVRRLQEIVDDQQRGWRLGATLFFYFGALALVVAAIGLYGVISYNVAQRMHELSVRVALGARRSDILALVAGQGARFAAGGAVIGLAIAFAASRWIQPLLFQQSATDPVVYAGVAALMIGVALLACSVPAMTAANADPNAALRVE
jgi:putative ABC transport system permease protein